MVVTRNKKEIFWALTASDSVYCCVSNGSETLKMIETTALIYAAQANSPPHFSIMEETVLLA